MKFKRALVERLVKEELLNHLLGLNEAPEDEKEPEEKDKQKPAEKEPATDKKQASAQKKPPAAVPAKDTSSEPEVPDEEDPADDELEPPTGQKDDSEGDKRGPGKVSDELVGKRVQSITMEPKSKLVPGAMEVVLTFDETPDPLKIIVTKTGAVKFYYRGLHNLP